MKCKGCGGENRDEAKFCIHCGARLCELAEGEVGEGEKEAIQAPLYEAMHEAGEEHAAEIVGEPEGEHTEAQVAVGAVGVEEVKSEFEALPEGALISDRRYELRSLLRETSSLNIYEAHSMERFKRCPSCDKLSMPEHNFCDNCGASIEGVPSTKVLFTVLEVQEVDEKKLDEIAEMCDASEGALPKVHEKFVYEPYEGSVRSYLVLERFDECPLSEIDISTMRLDALLIVALKLLKFVQWLSEHSYHVPRLIEQVTVKDDSLVLFKFEALQEAMSREEAIRSMLPQARRWLIEALGRFAEVKQSTIESHMALGLKERFESSEEPMHADELSGQIEAALNELLGTVALEYASAGATDMGKMRELNEDGFIIWELTGFQHPKPFRIGLYAVADGMGGHRAGEVACKLALDTLLDSIQEAISSELKKGVERLHKVNWGDVLKTAFERANRAVQENAVGLRSDMGTTMVAALVFCNRAYIANVGDSRAYIFREAKLKQITKDHSLVQQFVDMGKLTPHEAKVHPQRNIIYRAIGLRQHIEVDLFEEMLSVGDKLLLCSDGLCDMVEDEEIEKVLLTECDLNAACTELIRRANEYGGMDNITVVIVEAKQSS
ncbi:MAG: Stp1/IreP family PP2C-type Ser/Thr phosphatase [Armatimonadota bacterium]|nr:Stp1/IreP family PP2C-type Ser/Thr phosphatase [Armatimonadota bacterium]MCX7776732.1 Stp1/IreP family PP2C-type Ser/Thr phosphatase [Armatimonadota bacterium]MDW8025801.1 Stp1/IreP family PP2C-type Ser/Thr phosphatase [Armatimonadota bacterium]